MIIIDNFIKKLLKSYLQLLRLKKRKNYSFKNTIYNTIYFVVMIAYTKLEKNTQKHRSFKYFYFIPFDTYRG